MKTVVLTAEDCLSAALAWWARGDTPIPIIKGTKKPPRGFGWKRLQHHRPTEANVRSWWQRWPDAQVAVLLGRKMVVIDTDGESAEARIAEMDLPRTPTQKTPRGRHRFFSVDEPTPGRSLAVADGSSLEMRGLGQYVLVDPSIHPTGVQYMWEIPPTEAPAPLPREVLQLFPQDGCNARQSSRTLSQHLQDALRRNRHLTDAFYGRIEPPNDRSGSGRDILLAHACRRAGLPEADAETIVRAAPYPKRNKRTDEYLRRTLALAYSSRLRTEPKSGGYGTIPAGVVNGGIWANLSPKAQTLYVVFRVRSLRPSGLVRDGRAKLTTLAGVCDDSLTEAMAELEAAGLIRRKRWRQGTNVWVTNPTCTGKIPVQVEEKKAVAEHIPPRPHLNRGTTGVGKEGYALKADHDSESLAKAEEHPTHHSCEPMSTYTGDFPENTQPHLRREKTEIILEDINPWAE